MLLGDVNLMGVADPAVPFARVGEMLGAADVVFANLECCFHESGAERAADAEGFHAPLAAAEALRLAGVHAVGNANNVNYGAAAIRSSCARLRAIGVPFTGAGEDRALAFAPVVIERGGTRYGFLQRTSVYWTHGHEARDDFPGVATLKAHTAYRPRVEETRALTRPGMAPEVVTWADPAALAAYRDDVAALREQADVVVASHHWGLDGEVLDYQREIAHAAIDAGADVVMGHGPHVPLGIGFDRGRPIFYGLGSFSFETGHRRRRHPDWIGLAARIDVDGGAVAGAAFRFVRHNARNETVPLAVEDEPETLAALRERSAPLGTRIDAEDGWGVVRPA